MTATLSDSAILDALRPIADPDFGKSIVECARQALARSRLSFQSSRAVTAPPPWGARRGRAFSMGA